MLKQQTTQDPRGDHPRLSPRFPLREFLVTNPEGMENYPSKVIVGSTSVVTGTRISTPSRDTGPVCTIKPPDVVRAQTINARETTFMCFKRRRGDSKIQTIAYWTLGTPHLVQ
jgi:hypothetical protein